GALRRGRGKQVWRIHQPVRRAMVLVEPDPVIAQPVELLPSLQMLGISPHRDFGFEVFLWQRIGQLVADFQMLELLPICQEIEYEDFHVVRQPPLFIGPEAGRYWSTLSNLIPIGPEFALIREYFLGSRPADAIETRSIWCG